MKCPMCESGDVSRRFGYQGGHRSGNSLGSGVVVMGSRCNKCGSHDDVSYTCNHCTSYICKQCIQSSALPESSVAKCRVCGQPNGHFTCRTCGASRALGIGSFVLVLFVLPGLSISFLGDAPNPYGALVAKIILLSITFLVLRWITTSVRLSRRLRTQWIAQGQNGTEQLSRKRSAGHADSISAASHQRNVQKCRCSVCNTVLELFSLQDGYRLTSREEMEGKALCCAECGKVICSKCIRVSGLSPECPHCASSKIRPYSVGGGSDHTDRRPAKWRYVAMGSKGNERTGEVDAVSERDAIKQIKALQMFPTKVSEVCPARAPTTVASSYQPSGNPLTDYKGIQAPNQVPEDTARKLADPQH